MTFANIARGSAVFVDANTFVFHFQPHAVFGPACTALFKRVELQEISGYCTTHVLSEVVHRLMTIEARTKYGWFAGKLLHRLKQNSTAVQGLTTHRVAVKEALQSRLQFVSVTPVHLATASSFIQQYGLLSNDALVVAVMQSNGLTNLASLDADFDRVPGITRFGPT
jgi:predicted nucleic acid-binding protein